MAKQIVVLALILFAAVGMASAASSPSPSAAPTKSASAPTKSAAAPTKSASAPTKYAAGPTKSSGDEASDPFAVSPSFNNLIGSGDGAKDAAPVGGPVPDGTFPNLAIATSPTGAATSVEATTVAGVMAAAAVAGALFF